MLCKFISRPNSVFFIWKFLEIHTTIIQTILPSFQIDDLTGRSLSFLQLSEEIDRLSYALYDRGIRHGDVIFYTSTNNIECLLCTYAVVAIGGVVATCNPVSTEGK